MPLTPEQTKAYLADPTKCPFGCDSCTFQLIEQECDDDKTIKRTYRCLGCQNKFEDIYTLTDITLTREPRDNNQ